MSDHPEGPLAGVRVVEVRAIGPGPFGATILSDLGAEVVLVDRPETVRAGHSPADDVNVLARGRRSVGVDLKSPDGVATLLRLVERADVLVEGFRPGVMERLGAGPDECLARNPRLVYARVTGWGQDGPWAAAAGHDINYIALSGTLWPIGRGGEAPVPPLNYVGDFGGGGMLVAVGVIAALFERERSGRGQVVDAAMVDGAGMINAFLYGMREIGWWSEQRGQNVIDTGAPFYEVYETADGRWVSVGAIEPKFYRNLLDRLGLDLDPEAQNDRGAWPATKKRFAEVFRTRTRDEWAALFEGVDACFAPVLSPWEAPEHPHHRARGAFTDAFGLVQPSPAPRFGRTPARIAGPPPRAGQHTDEILGKWGLDADEIARLRSAGAIA
ncbi:CaiB/BaiF CoA transferase family protein [Phytohabitans kaempferiae]|uniref:CaiB/BaiF CoA transferase family protein n=1 Tax=Phytohabitans kaempferiae TaxID=1620943 RepID=A0ABV6M5S5_9ACTN